MESGPLFVDALSPAMVHMAFIRTGCSTDMKRIYGVLPEKVCGVRTPISLTWHSGQRPCYGREIHRVARTRASVNLCVQIHHT